MRYIFISILIFNASYLMAKDPASDCAKIKQDKERLACYDNIFQVKENFSKETKQKVQVEPINTIEPSTAKIKTDERSKKINNQKITEFGLTDSQKKSLNIQVDKITISTSILNVVKSTGGKSRFKLANKQLWESQSVLSSIKRINFKAKNEITIEESALGGFWMINKRSNVRIKVKRIS